jgi:hypothetical protein
VLVELRSGKKVWYKPLEELTREEHPAALEAERAKVAWLKRR